MLAPGQVMGLVILGMVCAQICFSDKLDRSSQSLSLFVAYLANKRLIAISCMLPSLLSGLPMQSCGMLSVIDVGV